MNRQVDGHIEDARHLGKIHAQEKDVAPAAVAEVHADGCGFVEDWKWGSLRSLKKFRAHAKGVIGGMPRAEHPLIAPHGADTSSHLVGQRLETEPTVSGGEGARKG